MDIGIRYYRTNAIRSILVSNRNANPYTIGLLIQNGNKQTTNEMKEEEYKDRICNYSGLLSIEQYQWIDDEEEEWTEEEWARMGHS